MQMPLNGGADNDLVLLDSQVIKPIFVPLTKAFTNKKKPQMSRCEFTWEKFIDPTCWIAMWVLEFALDTICPTTCRSKRHDVFDLSSLDNETN